MSKRIDGILYNLLIDEFGISNNALDSLIADNPGLSGPQLLARFCEKKFANEADLLRALAGKIGAQFKYVKGDNVDRSILAKIPVKFSTHYQFVPLSLNGKVLNIAVYYPLDINIQDELRMQLGYEINSVLSTRDDVSELMKKVYGLGAGTLADMIARDDLGTATPVPDIDDIKILGEDPTVANLVNQIILEAYKKRATDIHIEPYRGRVRFRYRIDGVLYDANVSPAVKNFIFPVLSRIKIMANLDIVERRLPQDGKAIVKVGDEKLDLRVSSIPTPYGESVVIRILPSVVLYDIDMLGLLDRDKEILYGLLKRPNGIIFVTGPTGSGKTTTLYACLTKLNTSDRKIINIEDPIEYEMDGITQIQVNTNIGLTFAAGLRSMLRHDPDVMMVGEVRDLETAEIAIRVALTGHLVFSTLHTNSASSSIHRLLDIGIEPYLIYSSTIAFVAQRLVRVLCPKCRAEDNEIEPAVVQLIHSILKMEGNKKCSFYKGKGCDYCSHTGFYGRTAVYEILVLDDNIKNLIAQRAPSGDIENSALAAGMSSMLQNGLLKVINGVTTIEEIATLFSLGKISRVKKESAPSPSPAEPFVPAVERITLPSDRRVYRRLNPAFVNMAFTIFKGISPEMQLRVKSRGIKESDYWVEHNTIAENISAGGLLFKHELPFFVDLILNIKIFLPSKSGAAASVINCLSKIVRVDESVDSSGNRYAVCFLDMSNADRVALNNFVKEMDESQSKQSSA